MSAQNYKLALRRMASGHWCLEVSDTVSWEYFPQFADELLATLGAEVLEKAEAVDIRIWDVLLRGCRLRLVYEDYPSNVASESSINEGDRALREVKKALELRFP